MYGLKLDSVWPPVWLKFPNQKMKIWFNEDYEELLKPENIKVKQYSMKDLNSMSLVQIKTGG